MHVFVEHKYFYPKSLHCLKSKLFWLFLCRMLAAYFVVPEYNIGLAQQTIVFLIN